MGEDTSPGWDTPPGWEVPKPGEVWSTPSDPSSLPPSPSFAPPHLTPESAYPAPSIQEPVLHAGKLAGLSITVCLLLVLAGIASVAARSALAQRADVVGRLPSIAASEVDDYFADAVDADDDVSAALGAYVLLVLPTGILWIIWQRRYVRNAQPFAPVAPSLGWGTFGWLCPFANMYFPEAQLANAAKATDPAKLVPGRAGAAPASLYLWWIAFSGATLIQLAGRWTRPSESEFISGARGVRDFQRADELASLGFAVGALAAVLAIVTVLVCSARQRRMLAALGVSS